MSDALHETLTKMMEEALQKRKSDGGKDFPPRPPTWTPTAAGAILEAQILSVYETRYGIRRVVVDNTGEQWVLPSSFRVLDELTRSKAGVGDVVFVKYNGLKKTKKGFNMKDYDVVVVAKDAFERTGAKFPEPKPIKPEAQTEDTAPQGKDSPAPTQSSPPQQESKKTGMSTEDMTTYIRRIADMAGKAGGIKKTEVERMVGNFGYSLDDILLLGAGIVRVDGEKVVKV